MRTRSLIVLALTAAVACDSPAEKPSSPTQAADKPAEKPVAKTADTPADTPTSPPVEKGPDAPPAASAKPTAEWLVWHAQGDGWVTRWVADVGGSTKTLAERKALVHTGGSDLFQIARRDVTAPIKTCGCMDPEFSAPDSCERTGSVAQPGLISKSLSSGKERDLIKPDGETVFGEIYNMNLAVVGGVDGKLIVRQYDGGYYCGAHQSVGGGDAMYDLTEDKVIEWPKVTFPRSVKEKAARWASEKDADSMFALFDTCDGEQSFDEFVDGDTMSWYALNIGLKAGKPALTWGFAADVYYACSPDYISHGETTTGLLTEAASLGLGGALPPALARGMAELGDKSVVGWGELKLASGERDALLQSFTEVPETPWPSPEAVVTESAKAADPSAAKAKLQEGRTKTRAKDFAGAIAALDAAVAADATHARAWGARGYAKLLDGQLDAAKKDCERALALGDTPGFKASVHYNLGLIAQKQGDKPAAKKAFAASLALRPNKEVQKALDSL